MAQVRRRLLPDAPCQLPDDIPVALQRIYRARGIHAASELDYSLARLPSPDLLKGLPAALQLLDDAIRQQHTILIVGDYDADGATSTALAMLGLKAMGAAHVHYLLPDRFKYGYGLSPAIVELAAAQQPDLIITVDNGIASHAGVDAAHAQGIKVLVTDHHLPADTLPSADAIVNPNQPGCHFPSRALAGVGVMFYVLVALRSHLRETGWFSAQRPEPNVAEWLDLVAVGTVADVVPLDHVNRILVEQGLRRIRAGQCRPGITALLEVGKRDPVRAVASDLGFAVGPRLNAAGRLADMSEGVHCLLETDAGKAWQYAQDLDAKNRERREIESGMQDDAATWLAQFGSAGEDLPWGLAVFEPHWHQGVVGILASRLKDKLHRPVFAFAPGESGELKGSGRSIAGFHLRDALDAIATRHPGLIDRFGGHAMAAGLSMREEALPQFAEAFDALAREWLAEDQLQAVIWSDGELSAHDMNLSLAKALRTAGPWGQKFPEPLFDGVFTVEQERVLADKHLKLRLRAGENATLLDAIWFFADLDRWAMHQPGRIRLVYRLDANEYRGIETVQLLVEAVDFGNLDYTGQ
ncbi:MAG: single-stranded-DNA-specific exonuclease RecJ [Gammaproteobacteria bacterium]|nr:MAG: single-stranded-DNA-specific exonuclease RecJ [Gammaproteobacteria bacterium]